MTSLVGYLVFLMLASASIPVREQASLKQLLLLAASYAFYATWGITFLVVLVASSVINFGLGYLLRRRPTLGRLWLGVIFNVALLSFFKYLPAFTSAVTPNAGITEFFHRVVMPAGMSFWTFQALSYLFDIYHEEEIDPSLLEFSLYMAFWPTVLMGPVCRLPQMLLQFRENTRPSATDLKIGVSRICTGLFMKLILAQLLASGLNVGFGVKTGFETVVPTFGGLDVWLLAIGFGFQLFFDFAGYSHIVIGGARLFGFRLEENFDAPYLSATPSVFWTKWHKSLSSWIRDYVFVPVATLRRESWWRYFALMASMILFGLWHGVTITFVLWGTYHGVFLVLHRVSQQLQRTWNFSMNGTLGNLVSWVITFLGISLGWILFRANDVNQAATMFRAILTPAGYFHLALPGNYYRFVLALVGGYFAYNAILQIGLMKEQGRSNVPFRTPVLGFVWENRRWWLTPLLATLSVFVGMIVWFQNAGLTPFIYTLF